VFPFRDFLQGFDFYFCDPLPFHPQPSSRELVEVNDPAFAVWATVFDNSHYSPFRLQIGNPYPSTDWEAFMGQCRGMVGESLPSTRTVILPTVPRSDSHLSGACHSTGRQEKSKNDCFHMFSCRRVSYRPRSGHGHKDFLGFSTKRVAG